MQIIYCSPREQVPHCWGEDSCSRREHMKVSSGLLGGIWYGWVCPCPVFGSYVSGVIWKNYLPLFATVWREEKTSGYRSYLKIEFLKQTVRDREEEPRVLQTSYDRLACDKKAVAQFPNQPTQRSWRWCCQNQRTTRNYLHTSDPLEPLEIVDDKSIALQLESDALKELLNFSTTLNKLVAKSFWLDPPKPRSDQVDPCNSLLESWHAEEARLRSEIGRLKSQEAWMRHLLQREAEERMNNSLEALKAARFQA